MKIILADENALERTGIKVLLQKIAQNAEIIEVQNTNELLSTANKVVNIKLVLLDLSLSGEHSCMNSIPQLRQLLPNAALVVLSQCGEYKTIRQTLDLGVTGFIPKLSTYDVLENALKIVLSGGVYIPETLLQSRNTIYLNQGNSNNKFSLTNRQMEILELLGSGNTNRKIGSLLGLTESTIRTHLTTIFKMLHVSNRTEAGYQARKLGLIQEEAV